MALHVQFNVVILAVIILKIHDESVPVTGRRGPPRFPNIWLTDGGEVSLTRQSNPVTSLEGPHVFNAS
jgi:hypothetical protein